MEDLTKEQLQDMDVKCAQLGNEVYDEFRKILHQKQKRFDIPNYFAGMAYSIAFGHLVAQIVAPVFQKLPIDSKAHLLEDLTKAFDSTLKTELIGNKDN